MANVATGKIYIGGLGETADHFEVYDPLDDSLTTLASPTLVTESVVGHATLTLVYPGE